MNNYCIIVTPQAEEQIRDIAYYIAVNLQEPGAAEEFVDELQEAFQTISSNPERPKAVYMSLSKSFINFSTASLKTALGVVPASLQAFLNASASGIFILQRSTV